MTIVYHSKSVQLLGILQDGSKVVNYFSLGDYGHFIVWCIKLYGLILNYNLIVLAKKKTHLLV